jgi:hypothetical protein
MHALSTGAFLWCSITQHHFQREEELACDIDAVSLGGKEADFPGSDHRVSYKSCRIVLLSVISTIEPQSVHLQVGLSPSA